MDDQRVICRAPLRREDPSHRSVIIGARAETVDGFGRKCDQFTGREGIGGHGDRKGIVSVQQHDSARGIRQRQNAGKPSTAAACSATARACSAVVAVTVR